MKVKLCGLEIEIDEEDLHLTTAYKWRPIEPNKKLKNKKVYLGCPVRVDSGKRTTQYLQHAIMAQMIRFPPEYVLQTRVIFADGNTLNYKRENLKIVDPVLAAVTVPKGVRKP